MEFEKKMLKIREFDWPKRESCHFVIHSFSNIMVMQAYCEKRMAVRGD